MNIGKGVKSIRKQKGIRANELAARSGRTAAYISMMENGIKTNVSSEVIEDICNALEVTKAKLIIESLEPSDVRPEMAEMWAMLLPTIQKLIQ